MNRVITFETHSELMREINECRANIKEAYKNLANPSNSEACNAMIKTDIEETEAYLRFLHHEMPKYANQHEAG